MIRTPSEDGWIPEGAYQPNLGTQKWIERQVANLPSRWKKRLVNRWHSEVPGGRNFDASVGRHPEYFANTKLKKWAVRLGGSRLPLDASDIDICNAADQLAKRGLDLASVLSDQLKSNIALPSGHITGEYSVIKQLGEVITFAVPADKKTEALRAAMNRIAEGQKIEPPQAWDEKSKAA
jgi:hypothetical protein